MKERPIIFSAPMVLELLAGRKTQTRRIVRTREPLGFIGGSGEESDPARWGWFFDGRGRDQHGYMVLARGLDERCNHGSVSIPCPYGEPGDRLWVRETWCRASYDAIGDQDSEGDDGRPRGPEYRPDPDSDTVLRPFAYYHATDPDVVDANDEERSPWKSPIHMPRWAARITLEVTDVRVQRLQDISEADILAEGVTVPLAAKVTGTPWSDIPDLFTAWRLLWDHVNGERRERVPTQIGDKGYVLGRGYRTEVDRSGSWYANPWVWVVMFKRVEAA